jgi:hypothetical protein
MACYEDRFYLISRGSGMLLLYTGLLWTNQTAVHILIAAETCATK